MNGEDIDVDDSDLALHTKRFKRIFNKRKFRRGPMNLNPNQLNNQRGKGKQEANKKQGERWYECGQFGYYMNKCPMKKKEEGKGKRRQKFNNFQITWNECNSNREI